MTTLSTEEAWLNRLEQSKVIGICFLDPDGKLVQRIDDDLAVRDAVIECQAERVRQLRLSEGSPVTYPNLEA
jgi:hypothetical protein